jgi:hypothetical protein
MNIPIVISFQLIQSNETVIVSVAMILQSDSMALQVD